VRVSSINSQHIHGNEKEFVICLAEKSGTHFVCGSYAACGSFKLSEILEKNELPELLLAHSIILVEDCLHLLLS
jgi:hypothetical protein